MESLVIGLCIASLQCVLFVLLHNDVTKVHGRLDDLSAKQPDTPAIVAQVTQAVTAETTKKERVRRRSVPDLIAGLESGELEVGG